MELNKSLVEKLEIILLTSDHLYLLQESDDPGYVALLAAHTTHREVLGGERQRTPVLCDHASDFIEEAVR